MLTNRLRLCGAVLLILGVFWCVPEALPETPSPEVDKRTWDLAWGVLTQGLSEQSSTKRTQAIAGLGSIGPMPRVVQLLEWALKDPESNVRQIAAATLGEIRSHSSAPKLRQALEDEHPEVSFAAAKALWDMADLSGREIFLQVLAGERSDTHQGVSGTVHETKKKLRDPGSLAFTGVKEAAGFVLGPFALGIMLAEELTKDSSAPARTLAATLLGTDSDPRSLDLLEQALADKNWIVRAAAAKAIGRRSESRSMPKLELLLKDEKDAVRYMAAAALVRLNLR